MTTDALDRSLQYLADEMTKLEAKMIDPVDYGNLKGRVETLQRDVADIKADVRTLVDLANRSKGGFWVGMSIASVLGGAMTFIAERLLK